MDCEIRQKLELNQKPSPPPSCLAGVNRTGALTTGCICCRPSKAARPNLLRLEGFAASPGKTSTASQDPRRPAVGFTVAVSHQWLLRRSPSRLSQPGSQHLMSSLEDSHNFLFLFPIVLPTSELMVWVVVVCFKLKPCNQ